MSCEYLIIEAFKLGLEIGMDIGLEFSKEMHSDLEENDGDIIEAVN